MRPFVVGPTIQLIQFNVTGVERVATPVVSREV